MAKAAPTIPNLKLPPITALPQNYPFAVHVLGAGLYESLRVNKPVTLEQEDGTKVEATVQSVTVGALIDLIQSTGSSSIVTYGKTYSPLSLVQAMTDASPDDVLDVTKLYTAVTVTVPMVAPPMTGMPA